MEPTWKKHWNFERNDVVIFILDLFGKGCFLDLTEKVAFL